MTRAKRVVSLSMFAVFLYLPSAPRMSAQSLKEKLFRPSDDKLLVAKEKKTKETRKKEHNSCCQREFGQFSDWSAPVNLGPVVKSQGKEFNNQHPAISKNGLSLYFVSNRPGGFGRNDIWVSQRPSLHAAWGPPQNLGAAINTEYNDLLRI